MAARALPAPVLAWSWRSWLRANFAATPASLATTVAGFALLIWLLPRACRWFVADATLDAPDYEACVRAGGACWSFLADKWRLILFGPYTYDEQWRAALAVALFAAMAIGSAVPAAWAGTARRRLMLALWAATALAVAALMRGGVLGLPVVEARLWGGLPLTLLIAAVGCAFAFVLGVALALGRRSTMPVVRWLCIGFIEFMRGVPLIALLFMAGVMFPLILPPGADIDKLLRAQVAFILFFAAYTAEAVRGGLQAIPRGQFLAAEAIGLGWWQAQRRVVLPQALAIVIPSLVGIAIAAFKDTSLVTVIAMLDLLGTANAAKADPRWWGIYIEAYLFVAAIYLAVCAAMARYSRFLERRLAAGGGHG